MNIEIKIDSSCIDPKIIIMTASVTEKVNNILKILSEDTPRMITGIKEDKEEILDTRIREKRYALPKKAHIL